MSSRRPSSGRPAVPKRSADSKGSETRKKDSDLEYECKAAYLTVLEDTSDDINSKKQLRSGKKAISF